MAIPDNNSGWGQRGEIQITHQNDETRRRIPIRMMANVALLINGLTMGGYAISWLVRAQRVWESYTPRGYLSEWGAFWARLGAVWSALAEHIGARVFLLPIPLILEWFLPVLILILFNLIPKMLNDEWPLTYGQVDPEAHTSALTFWQWMFGRRRQEVDAPGGRIVVEGIVRAENGDTRTRFETEYPERWQRYLRALVTGPAALRPGFSVRSATNIFYRVPREEFETVSDQWLRIGYAAATSAAPNARRYLTAKGEAFARGWATQEAPVPLAAEVG